MERAEGLLGGKSLFKSQNDGTNDKTKVVCSICQAEFSYHLNAKHPTESSPRLNDRQHTLFPQRPIRLFGVVSDSLKISTIPLFPHATTRPLKAMEAYRVAVMGLHRNPPPSSPPYPTCHVSSPLMHFPRWCL